MRSSPTRSPGVRPCSARCGPAVVVFVLPMPELLGELLGGSKDHPPVKLLLVGSMAAFHLAVAFGGAAGDMAMADPEVTQVPGEVGPELRAVVGLDPLNGPAPEN